MGKYSIQYSSFTVQPQPSNSSISTLYRHIPTGTLCIQKTLFVFDINVYAFLFDNQPKGIPKVFGFDLQADGSLMVMEQFIQGRTMAEIIKERGPFPKSAGYRYLLCICETLALLHSISPTIIHRDIKPENIIIITDRGEVFLIDFNAATIYNPHKDMDTVLLGTQGYAAPEQYGFKASTPKTDIYALGMLAQDIFIGQHLPPNLYHGPYRNIVCCCLNLDPAKRYADAGALRNALLGASNDVNTRKLPGFRSGKFWKAAIAILYYAFFTLMVFLSLLGGSFVDIVAYSILLVMFWSAPLFVFNYRNMLSDFPFTNDSRLWVRILARCFYVYAAMGTLFLTYGIILEFLNMF